MKGSQYGSQVRSSLSTGTGANTEHLQHTSLLVKSPSRAAASAPHASTPEGLWCQICWAEGTEAAGISCRTARVAEHQVSQP